MADRSSSPRRTTSGAARAPSRESHAQERTDSENGEQEDTGIWAECARTFPEYAVAYDDCLTPQDFMDQQVQLAAEYGNRTALDFWIDEVGIALQDTHVPF